MSNVVFSACALLGLVSLASADPVTSTFDVGAEGWQGICLSASGYSRKASYALSYSATGGVASGYVHLEDPDGDWWYFDAPSGYLGNQSVQYGGTLGYWLNALLTATSDTSMPSVVLRGGGKVLTYWKPDLPVASTWKYFEAPMAPSDRWRDQASGLMPTPTAFQTVLANLTSLEIRGEHYVGNDREALDNVRLGPAQASAVQDAFDTNPGDWVGVSYLLNDSNLNHLPMGPFALTWMSTGGRSGGCLKRADYDDNVSFWRLPDRYSGKRSALVNRTLSWWTYNEGSGSPIVPTYPDVVLLGATQSLIADVAGNPPQKVWTETQVRFDVSTPWRLNSRSGRLATQPEVEQVLSELCAIYVNSEFIDGPDESRIDDVALSQGPAANLALETTLQDWVGPVAGQEVDVRLTDSLGASEAHHAVLDGEGKANLSTYLRGDLVAIVKASHWLARSEPCNVPDAGGSVAVSLVNGDCDGDNAVTVFDYNVLSDAFDSAEGDPGWNANADLDGDGVVTVFDYNILSQSFDQTGDE